MPWDRGTLCVMTASFYLNRNTDEVAATSLCEGIAVLWSRRSPTKDTPNEDAGVVITLDDHLAVLAIADGVGGIRSGDVAARVAVESLGESLEQCRAGELAVRGAILNGIEAANRKILEMGLGAATTLAVLEINGQAVRPYHVGDSIILIFGARGKIKWQTTMHSPVGFAVEAGVLDEREALHHEDRHLVSNVVGSSEMRIEIGPSLQLAARDTVLLASDGLIDNLTVREIVQLLRKGRLEKSVGTLSRAVWQRMLAPEEGHPSKPDDATILAFRRSHPSRKSPAPKPVRSPDHDSPRGAQPAQPGSTPPPGDHVADVEP
jgi:serine/threonine protein phosphatase PrpC